MTDTPYSARRARGLALFLGLGLLVMLGISLKDRFEHPHLTVENRQPAPAARDSGQAAIGDLMRQVAENPRDSKAHDPPGGTSGHRPKLGSRRNLCPARHHPGCEQSPPPLPAGRGAAQPGPPQGSRRHVGKGAHPQGRCRRALQPGCALSVLSGRAGARHSPAQRRAAQPRSRRRPQGRHPGRTGKSAPAAAGRRTKNSGIVVTGAAPRGPPPRDVPSLGRAVYARRAAEQTLFVQSKQLHGRKVLQFFGQGQGPGQVFPGAAQAVPGHPHGRTLGGGPAHGLGQFRAARRQGRGKAQPGRARHRPQTGATATWPLAGNAGSGPTDGAGGRAQ